MKVYIVKYFYIKVPIVDVFAMSICKFEHFLLKYCAVLGFCIYSDELYKK